LAKTNKQINGKIEKNVIKHFNGKLFNFRLSNDLLKQWK
jgi:hypothetical protein